MRNHEIPFETRGSKVVFNQSEIDLWASRRILKFSERPLGAYHRKSTDAVRGITEEPLLASMLTGGGIAPAMTARTKHWSSANWWRPREDRHVCDPKELLESVTEREQSWSTALPGGFALPHPRHHDPYLFDESFLIVGRTIQEIHFGAPDGQPTYVFFLICCPDERLHLHALARVCLVAQKPSVMEQLRKLDDPAAITDCLVRAEQLATPVTN